MKEFTTKYIGNFGEKYCAKFLKKQGYKIIGKNVRIGHLETDIIAINKDYILFTEVKTRRVDLKNDKRPASAVNYDKKTNLLNFAYAYMRSLSQKYADKQPRIDVCEISVIKSAKKLVVCDMNYIENAITR